MATEEQTAQGPSVGSLRRYRYVLAAATIACALVGAVGSSIRPTVYEAGTTLFLRDPSSPGVFTTVRSATDTEQHVRREANRASSRSALERAAERLGTGVDELQARVDVRPDPELNQILITARAPTPEDAASTANTVASAYEEVALEENRADIEAANEVLQQQIADLRQQADELDAQLNGSPRDAGAASRIQTVGGEILALEGRSSELAASGAVFGSGVDMREDALPPDQPASPRPVRAAALGAAIGLGLSSVAAYWRARTSRLVETRADPATVLDVPLLGEIPRFRKSAGLAGGGLLPGVGASEAYEFVLSSIEFALGESGGSSVLITSAAPGDGKTATALHLAMASAREAHNVVLVDTDIRAHGLTSRLLAEGHPGLVELATADIELKQCIRRYRMSEATELSVMPAGKAPENPTGLMRAPEFKDAIGRINAHAQLVIFDSAPMLAVADATVIAKQVDAIVLVVDSRTPVDELRRTHELLAFVPTPVLGYVYNRAESSPTVRYGYGYGYGKKDDRGRLQRFLPRRSYAGSNGSSRPSSNVRVYTRRG